MSSLLKTFYVAAFLFITINVQWRRTPLPELPNWRNELTPSANLSVNLVVASLRDDDISWTSKLNIPNLNVIRYISDSEDARFRPPVPRKGREATIYHTYFYDFYDDLPDLSIMIHPHEDPWHIEGVLQRSMLFALSRLDIEQAHQRGYVNLRVDWDQACPTRIDTSKTEDESDISEEPYISEAFTANFGPVEVPRTFAGPCCSQFAVTREAIHKHPRSQFKRSMDWLVDTSLSDSISGRTWEHMFPWLFLQKSVDCPDEWNSYCALYGICFEKPEDAPRYNELARERHDLEEDIEILREILDPQKGFKSRKRMAEIDAILAADIIPALKLGLDSARRSAASQNLYFA